MTVWLWIWLVSLILYWSIFCYLLTFRRWNAPALFFGVVHMLLASLLAVPPFRSSLDPNYGGLQVGLVRFEGRWAILPAAVFLAWALAAAWMAIARGRGGWMKLIAVGDMLFAANFIGLFLLEYLRGNLSGFTIQAGEHFTLSGVVVALVPILLLTLMLAASAVWAARRAHSDVTTPPLARGRKEEETKREEDSGGINGFRYVASRI